MRVAMVITTALCMMSGVWTGCRLSHLPAKLVSAHLNIPEETLAKFPRGAQGIVPLP